MYCSTCGSRVVEGRTACQVCGAAVARASQFPAAYPQAGALPAYATPHIQVCPRCGYRGMSTGYFSRTGHVAALVGLAVFFFPAALVYGLARHNHRACPSCGLGWGSRGTGAMTLVQTGGSNLPEVAVPTAEGGPKRGWAIAILILGGLLLAAGLSAFELAPIVMGVMVLGGGGLLMSNAKKASEQRRDNIIQSLQLPVLQLAGKKGGRLTVTDVATEMGWPMARAEKVLNSLDDGMRVMSDITDEGVIVYDFLEIRTSGLSNPDGLRLHA